MNKAEVRRQKAEGRTWFQVILHPSAFILICVLAMHAASAQPYPARPVRLIVPQSAGGSTDVIARVVAQKMAEGLGQPVVVDNRPGAGSINGVEMVVHAAPDGYTLLAVAGSFTINPALHKKLPFDAIRDFAPVTQLATLPHILIVHPSVPVKSVKDLIALAKARPGQLNYASSGIATSTHMAAELFMSMTGTNMVNVPYKGGSPAMVAMLSGQCQLNFATISTAIPHIRAGKLRALAVTSAKRSIAAPEFPTIAEAGLPGFDHSSWVGLLAPARTPQAAVARIKDEAVKATHAPEVKSALARDGLEATGTTSADFANFIKTDIAKWIKVAKAAGITAK